MLMTLETEVEIASAAKLIAQYFCGVILLAVIFILSAVDSFAVYPTTSHRAETHGQNNKSIGFNYSYEYEEDEKTGDIFRTNEYDTILSYGLLDNLDIIGQVPLKQISRENERDYSGVDDISLEAKWKFYNTESLNLAVYPEVTLPTGGYKNGVGNGRATFATTLIASKKIDRFSFHISGQYTRNENKTNDRLNLWEAHFSPVITVVEGFSLIGDVGLRRDDDKTNKKLPISVSGGFSYGITKNFSVTPVFKSEWNNEDKKDLTLTISSLLKF